MGPYLEVVHSFLHVPVVVLEGCVTLLYSHAMDRLLHLWMPHKQQIRSMLLLHWPISWADLCWQSKQHKQKLIKSNSIMHFWVSVILLVWVIGYIMFLYPYPEVCTHTLPLMDLKGIETGGRNMVESVCSHPYTNPMLLNAWGSKWVHTFGEG